MRSVTVSAIALAGLAFTPVVAQAQTPLPHVNICTGPSNGNYDFVGIQVAKQVKGTMHGKLVNTSGSMENLEKLDHPNDVEGCDVAIVQADAYNLYMKRNAQSALTLERGRVLYPEYVHFICNTAAGLSKITGLQKTQTVLVGPAGGGSWVTWESFKLADPARYGNIPTAPIGGTRAAGKVQDGSEATCMFYVAGLKSPGMMDIDALAKSSGDRLRLVNAQDSDMPGVKDPRGKVIYKEDSIPGGTYPNLQHGVFSTAVATIAVDSLFVANSKWVDENPDGYERLLRGLNAAMPEINNRVHPD